MTVVFVVVVVVVNLLWQWLANHFETRVNVRWNVCRLFICLIFFSPVVSSKHDNVARATDRTLTRLCACERAYDNEHNNNNK